LEAMIYRSLEIENEMFQQCKTNYTFQTSDQLLSRSRYTFLLNFEGKTSLVQREHYVENDPLIYFSMVKLT